MRTAHRTTHFLSALLVPAVAALAIVGGAALQPSPAHAATTDPFAIALNPASVVVSTLTGRSSAGTSLGIVKQLDGSIVGYLCDGTGTVSTWLTGQSDATGKSATLRGPKVTVQLDLVRRTADVSGAHTATIRLQVSTNGVGLLRHGVTVNGTKAVVGWVTTNDGWVTGTGAVDGKPIVNISQSVGDSEPTGGTTGSSDPVATGLLKNIRCGFLMVKVNRVQDGSNGPSTPAEREATDRFLGAGCNTALTGT